MSLVPFRKINTPSYISGLDDFDRIFENVFKNAMTNVGTTTPSIGDLMLHMDVSETNKAYHIEAEVPGIDEKDIEMTVKDNVLIISGEKHDEKKDEGTTFHRTERRYGSFKRSLQLPQDADEDKIEAHVKNGLLAIAIPKIREAQKVTKRIAIKKK